MEAHPAVQPQSASMRFFFVNEEPARLEGPWDPPRELFRHLRALRLSEGEAFLLLLPQGGAVGARLDGEGRVVLQGLTEMPQIPLLPVTLATAWPKGKRADDLVARATELGVERILPLQCERSVAGRQTFSPARVERWRRIALETCQQCGRPVPPTLDPAPVPLAAVLGESPRGRTVVLDPLAWPLAMELSLHAPREVLLIVGPEGGFTPEEIDWFEEHEIHRAGLGATRLRIEAAGPFAVGICQHWYLQLLSR